MSFSFGFEDDDDIEREDVQMRDSETVDTTSKPAQQHTPKSVPAAEPARLHKIEDLVCACSEIAQRIGKLIIRQLDDLPSKVSWSYVQIESPKGRKLRLPRRELFDVKIQLMAEDEGDSGDTTNVDNSDIRTNVYEGGYKSWECSFDLAKLLLDRGPRKDLDDLCRVNHVVEVCISDP